MPPISLDRIRKKMEVHSVSNLLSCGHFTTYKYVIHVFFLRVVTIMLILRIFLSSLFVLDIVIVLLHMENHSESKLFRYF